MLETLKKGKLKVTNLLFIILVIVYCITTSDKIGGSLSKYKYIILLLCIIEAFLSFSKNKKRNSKVFMKKEFKNLLFFVFIIIIYSFSISFIVGKFSFRTIQELIFLVCPMIYAYYMINILDKEEIHSNMKLSLIIIFGFYVFSLNADFKSIINSLLNSSFGNSSSNLESHIYCGFSIAYCFYFCYFSKEKKYKYLSLLFVIMTFKRLFIVMAIFIFILSYMNLREKKITDNFYIMSSIFLILFSITYYNIMLPENVQKIEYKYDVDISKFTSTRSDRLKRLSLSDYKSYGFGSSTEYMYANFDGALEMDIIKIIVELGYIPIIILIFSYLYYGKYNFYTFSYMAFQILNIIFSSSLTSSFSWILIFISLEMVSKYSNRRGDEINGVS